MTEGSRAWPDGTSKVLWTAHHAMLATRRLYGLPVHISACQFLGGAVDSVTSWGLPMSINVTSIARACAVSTALLSMGACATVTRGSSDAWEVTSEPSGAKVETTNGFQCPATPCAIKMPRKSEFTATVTKPGYKPATITVTHKTSGAGAAGVAGNVLVGGIIGLGVDAVTGASQDLVPNPAHVVLEKAE